VKFPWAAEDERIREEMKERETNRLRPVTLHSLQCQIERKLRRPDAVERCPCSGGHVHVRRNVLQFARQDEVDLGVA